MTILRQGSYTYGNDGSLFAANGVAAIPADGYTLASGLTGALLRGFPLKQGATAFELATMVSNHIVMPMWLWQFLQKMWQTLLLICQSLPIKAVNLISTLLHAH